jgi:hypothetical protein
VLDNPVVEIEEHFLVPDQVTEISNTISGRFRRCPDDIGLQTVKDMLYAAETSFIFSGWCRSLTGCSIIRGVRILLLFRRIRVFGSNAVLRGYRVLGWVQIPSIFPSPRNLIIITTRAVVIVMMIPI